MSSDMLASVDATPQLTEEELRHSMVVRICRVEELPEGAVRRGVVDGRRIAVARHRGVVHGFGATCPHQRHDLSQGFIADDGITCESHLWHFRFSDGRCSMIPEASIPVFPTREEGGWIVVDLPVVS